MGEVAAYGGDNGGGEPPFSRPHLDKMELVRSSALFPDLSKPLRPKDAEGGVDFRGGQVVPAPSRALGAGPVVTMGGVVERASHVLGEGHRTGRLDPIREHLRELVHSSRPACFLGTARGTAD